MKASLAPVRVAVAVVAAAIAVGGTASALVLTEKSEAQKLRADINGQQSKYVACLVKSNLNCEKSSTTIGSDCTLATGATQNGADSKGKYVADIAKCDGKLNYMKKAKTVTDPTLAYESLGCPGDIDSGTPGDQRLADMTEYQSLTPIAAKGQIDILTAIVGAVNASEICTALVGDTKKYLKCGSDFGKALGGYAAGIQKCILACENDYKDKKGNGGGTDATAQCALDTSSASSVDGTNTSGNANFNACVDKAFGKLAKKFTVTGVITSTLIGQINAAIGSTADDLYNEFDC